MLTMEKYGIYNLTDNIVSLNISLILKNKIF